MAPWERGVLAVLLVGLAALWAWAVPREYQPGWDSLLYYSGAEAIAKEGRYALEPFVHSPALGLYPPGQSMLLSLVFDAGSSVDQNIRRFQAICGAMGIGGLLLLHGIFRQAEVPAALRLAFVALVGSSPAWIGPIGQFFADVAFVCLGWALAWYWWRRTADPVRLGGWIGTGLILLAMGLFRTAVIGLVAVGLLVASVRGKGWHWRVAATGGPLAVFLVLWRLWGTGLPGYDGAFGIVAADWADRGGLAGFYSSNFRSIAGTPFLPADLAEIRHRIGHALAARSAESALVWQVAQWLLGTAAFLVSVYGLFRLSRGRTLAMCVPATSYFLLIAFSPFPAGFHSRYHVLVMPLCLIGVSSWARTRPVAVWMTAVLAGIAVAGNVYALQILRDHSQGAGGPVRELAAGLRSLDRGRGRVAAGPEVPVANLTELTGLRFVPDYLNPDAGRGMCYPISHRESGYAPARWVIVPDVMAASFVARSGSREVFRTTGAEYRIYEVDPTYELRRQIELYRIPPPDRARGD